MDIPEKASAMVENGLVPFEMKRNAVYDSENKITAYEASLKINSLDSGCLSEEDYQAAAERSKRGNILASKALKSISSAMDRFATVGEGYSWIAAKMPEKLLTSANMMGLITEAMGSEQKFNRLCLSFPSSLLFSLNEKTVASLNQLRDKGIKLALRGFGDDLCPVIKLGEFDFDVVFIHESVVSAINGSKSDKYSRQAEMLISFINGYKTQIVLPNTENEGQREACKRLRCFGYTVKSGEIAL